MSKADAPAEKPPRCEHPDDSLFVEGMADRYRVTCPHCGATTGWARTSEMKEGRFTFLPETERP